MEKLVEKLTDIQARLKAPKSQINKFGNYNYRNCEDILEALKPLLKEHKCVITLSDKIVNIGNRFYVEATATITDGETNINNTAYAREAENKKGMDESQITGAASSYARKYALNGLFGIDDTKDADTTNDSKDKETKPLTEDQINWIKSAESLEALKTICAEVKKTSPDCTKEIISEFNKMKGKLNGNN